MRTRRAILTIGLLIGALAGGCDTSGPATFPTGPTGPDRTASAAAATTVAELTRLLGERSLIVTTPEEPYAPSEAMALAAAPRDVLQVQMPDDPDGGWIVVYDFPDADAAMTAAREQADWIASGPGRVQTPIGTRHVIRVLGPTVVLYSWHPDAAPDPRAAEIADALAGFGIGVFVPA